MRTIVSASVGQGAGAPGLAGTQDQASQAPALGPMIEIQDPRSAQDPTCRPASLPWAALAISAWPCLEIDSSAVLPSPVASLVRVDFPHEMQPLGGERATLSPRAHPLQPNALHSCAENHTPSAVPAGSCRHKGPLGTTVPYTTVSENAARLLT